MDVHALMEDNVMKAVAPWGFDVTVLKDIAELIVNIVRETTNLGQ